MAFPEPREQSVHQYTPFTSWCVLIWNWSLLKLRLSAIFRSGPNTFRFGTRIKLFLGTIFRYVMMPMWIVFWLIDEVLYGGYRDVKLDDMVWILSTPRTGSSNLTDALLVDDRDFLSVRLIEVFFPFIWINRLVDGIEWLFALFGYNFEQVVKNGVLHFVDQNALDHHPMEPYQSTQTEVLHMLWLNVSPVSQFSFPDSEYWRSVCLFDRLDDPTYQRMNALRDICMKKVMYRRGRGRRMVFKAHSSEDAHNLYQYYPKANFIVGYRRPADQIPSILENCQAFSMSFYGYSSFTPNWIDARLEWLGHLWSCELNFCKNFPADERERRLMMVPFKRFLSDPEGVLLGMLKMCGVTYDGDAYLNEKVRAFVQEQKEYKNQRKYKNPSLEELGLSESEINGKFAEYIQYFGL